MLLFFWGGGVAWRRARAPCRVGSGGYEAVWMSTIIILTAPNHNKARTPFSYCKSYCAKIYVSYRTVIPVKKIVFIYNGELFKDCCIKNTKTAVLMRYLFSLDYMVIWFVITNYKLRNFFKCFKVWTICQAFMKWVQCMRILDVFVRNYIHTIG